MQLPPALQLAIQTSLHGTPQADLHAAAAVLSQRYRAGHGAADGPPGGRYVAAPLAALAYAAYRMPATYAAVAAALAALAARLPVWHPRSLLDVGAGLGAALWASATTWEDLDHADMIESAPAMLNLGRQLAVRSPHPAVSAAHWQPTDLLGAWRSPPHDLVTATYVLGELPAAGRTRLITQLWEQSSHALLLVEPGTPQGWAIIRAAREQLRAAGAYVVAPCPHQEACPLPADDWCHFAQRVARTKLQRSVKGVELAYEDEKFAYIAVARSPATPISARLLRHPRVRSGHIELRLCTPSGLRDTIVTRSAREQWREARGASWGDVIVGG
ncbi:small ribosomal subunit Rsm22 family protein [Candidatus Oscillochloris fontis]|uniref:small ribosomal subunit Rsm22 family protein n=1 Tax=Candidatus Oscillochloris fontis TaxID=2496868 RepID=UPI001376118D|nr:small ribosomal subunit Rsm22 family protein [Candidatus Oscillochloris fontis]